MVYGAEGVAQGNETTTPAELAASLQESEEKDPRSVFYKRVLDRPKLPVVRIVLTLLGITVGCALLWLLLYRWTGNHLPGLFTTAGLLVLGFVVHAKRVLILAVKLYQAVAPAKLRKRCRYEPSCSAYMLLAVEKYGPWKGLIKGLKRWKGCKPPNGGYDLP